MAKKQLENAVNEFNQVMKPVSLWADAWKRLRKNKMALISLVIVSIYVVISLFAPLLTSTGILIDYRKQVITNASLPPSFKPAGELVVKKIENRIVDLEKRVEEQQQQQSAFSSFFDFGSLDTQEESSEPSDGYTESQEGGFSFTYEGEGFSGNTTDPVVRELISQKETLERVKAELDTNPDYKIVYILGTDNLGRDMFARIIYGGRISIAIGIVGTLTAALVGILVGAISGYVGGWLDNFLMRFVDIMYGLPYMLIVIIIMAMIGEKARGSFVVLFVAIALVSWLTIARVVRGQIISLKNSEFVEAARSMGASTQRIIFRHLLPNTLGVIIVFSTLMMPSFIMNESFLSFLGLGVSAPDASWGTLVSEGVRAMESYAWQLLGPGIAMTIFLFCMNFLGDGLRDALDPQSKNRT
ncbi:MAG TPA: ABC transporter permease [Rectinema sp.]|nr:ABC transporter permease [Rectinema sp.]HOE75309.1 ABC transporter permease [Rectinema sp.]HOM92078.1 ABC transporter permease [Rectinema sp.]HPL70877.1 ABC transporter permease [Rectinema sp.]HPN02583.1 ABC transporter permease [Rectinema sp.]